MDSAEDTTIRRTLLSLHTLKKIGYCFGIGWSMIVIFRYMSVDNGFLFGLPKQIGSSNLLIFVALIGGAFLASGILLGFALSHGHRIRAIVVTAFIFAVSAFMWLLWPILQTSWDRLCSFEDSVRISLSITGAALLGIGMGAGFRLSRKPMRLWSLSACFVVPFISITLRAHAFSSLLALAWLVLLGDAIGILALRWLNHVFSNLSDTVERSWLVSIAVGMSILITLAFIVGLVGGTSTTGILLFLVVVSVVCVPYIKISLKRLTALPWNQPLSLSVIEVSSFFVLSALFMIFWMNALAPEIGSDALGVRAAMPAIWLRQGSITPLPQLSNSYGFFSGEVMYLLAMPLAGFQAAKVVQFALGLILAIGVSLQIFEVRHRSSSTIWMLLFWGSTIVWFQMIWGFVDLFQLFFYFVAIYALRLWLDEPDNSIWLVAAGLAGATATTSKFNGAGVLLLALIVVVGVTLRRSRSYLQAMKSSLVFGTSALVFLLPWIIRSYFLTGNPVFPFFNQLFKSPLAALSLQYPHFGVGMKFPEIIAVPWGLVFHPERYVEIGTYHPILLACAPLGVIGLLLSWRRDWLWGVTGVMSFVTWLVTEQNMRYSLYAAFLLTIALGMGMINIRDRVRHAPFRHVFDAVVLVGLIMGFCMQALRPTFWVARQNAGPAFPTKVVFGGQSQGEYLGSAVPSYFCTQLLNRQYGQNAKILQVPPLRDYLYPEASVFQPLMTTLPVGRPLIQSINFRKFSQSNADTFMTLTNSGFTHIMYSKVLRSGLGPIEDDWKGIFSRAFANEYLHLECADRGVRLYRFLSMPRTDHKSLKTEDNLAINGGLETLTSMGQPTNWIITGPEQIIKSSVNTSVMLKKDGFLIQPIKVREGQLYELSLEYRATKAGLTVYTQTNWLGPSDKMQLFWREPAEPSTVFRRHYYYQTAPDGAEKVVVYIFGDGVEVDNVRFREIKP